MSNSQIVDQTTFECFQASLPLHMACMVLGSSLPDRNSKKETVTDYISVVTAVGQPPTANRTPSAVTANPVCECTVLRLYGVVFQIEARHRLGCSSIRGVLCVCKHGYTFGRCSALNVDHGKCPWSSHM